MRVTKMNLDQFKQLIQSYGVQPAHWPSEVREAASERLASDPAAKAMVASEASLDDALNRYHTEFDTSKLKSAILAHLPRESAAIRLLDRVLDFLIPTDLTLIHLMRPALVATLPLVIGVVLGSTVSLDTQGDTVSFEDEIYMLALASDDTESLP